MHTCEHACINPYNHIQKVVKVDRNIYEDNIIEVEKTVYVDVPVYLDNTVEEVVEKFT